MEPSKEEIIFLGTAGARIMVTRQLLASGGAWLKLGGVEILFDPGPGCLVQAIKRKLDPSKLAAIILSHKHLDHSGDINIMIEAMTEGGFKRRGIVFAPSDALGSDPVIFSYLRSFPESIEPLGEGKSYTIGDVIFTTPIRHKHPVETYGFIFQTPKYTFSWVTDTRYFDGLSSFYKGELLIINVVRLALGAPIDHLALSEAKLIVESVKPKVAVLTHFGMTMWRAKPRELALRLSEEIGIPVISARDGMRFGLEKLQAQE